MSADDGDYIETFDPDGNILWFWYRQWHETAVTDDNELAESTKSNRRDSIRRFERFLAARKNDYGCHWTDIDADELSYDDIIPPRKVTPTLAEEFLIALQQEYAAQTQQTVFAELKQAYGWCVSSIKSVEINPFEKVEKKHKERQNAWILDTPSDRNPYILPLDEAREVVRSWSHPMWLSMQLVFAKLPRRAGGISNLDIEDVHIDHPGCEWTPHRDLRQWPDHITFRADKRESEDGRNTGNKTEEDGKYPIDAELKYALLWYLTIRPKPDSPSEPLFLSQTTGTRLSGSSISSVFTDRAKELGYWYGANDDDNLNPHYWRHWGTSYYQSQFGGDTDGYTALTKYLRGDSESDIIGLYDNYTAEKRDTILDTMPTFLEPYVDD